MADSLETCWTVVEQAARGEAAARSQFAHSYLGVVRAFLMRRWRGSRAAVLVDDAVQEIFLDLFRDGGALGRFDASRAKNFRTFLFGVVHKVALRYEERVSKDRRRFDGPAADPDEFPNDDPTVSRVFDREWAKELLQRARERLEERASRNGDGALRRVQLLRQRFQEGLPIREIAKRNNEDAAHLHHEYAKAREEFKAALRAEVAYHHRGDTAALEAECRKLLDLL